MAKEISKQNKKRVAVSLGRLMSGFVKGISGLFGLVAEMERQGKSKYIEEGEIEGRTKSGKKVRGAYHFGVRLGINPEDLRRPALKEANNDKPSSSLK